MHILYSKGSCPCKHEKKCLSLILVYCQPENQNSAASIALKKAVKNENLPSGKEYDYQDKSWVSGSKTIYQYCVSV